MPGFSQVLREEAEGKEGREGWRLEDQSWVERHV